MRFNKALVSIFSLAILGVVTITVQPNTAQAATTHSAKRSKSVKLVWRKSMKRHAYYTVQGSRYSAHLGANYGKTSKYPKTTWYSDKHEKLVVKKNKKARIYYHVVSGNKKHAGWIWKGYLTAGVNPAAKKSNTAKSSDYFQKLAAKLNKKYSKPTKAPVGTKEKESDVPDNNNYDLNTLRSEVVKQLNEWRVKAGVPVLKEDTRLTNMGNERAVQLRSSFDHYDKNDNLIIAMNPFRHQFNIPDSWVLTESIGGSDFNGSAKSEADDLLWGYRVEAKLQGDNGAHWNALMSKDYVGVGVGLANSDTGSNWKGQGFNASIVMTDGFWDK